MICDDCSGNPVRLFPSLDISPRPTGNDCVGKIIHHEESLWAALFAKIIDKAPLEFVVMRKSALQNMVSEGYISVKEKLHRAIAASILQRDFSGLHCI